MIKVVQLSELKRRFEMPFPLFQIGIIDSLPGKESGTMDKLELCIRLSCAGEFAHDQVEDIEYINRYPNVMVKVPGVYHRIRIDEIRNSIFIKYDSKLAPAMHKAGLLDPPNCWDFVLTPEINKMIREIQELLEKSHEYGIADRLDILCIMLWEELLMQRGRVSENSDYMDAKIRSIAAYFDLNFMKEIDIDELIHHNGLSRRNFYRCWKKSFKISPAIYLRNLKMTESCRLLGETRLSVNEISERLNFRNPSYFCLLFKEHFGKTPLQFKKEVF